MYIDESPSKFKHHANSFIWQPDLGVILQLRMDDDVHLKKMYAIPHIYKSQFYKASKLATN